MPLQIRRGLSSQMTSSVTPEVGEPIFTTDTDKLYIGDGTTTADVLVPVNPDMDTRDLGDVSTSLPVDGQFLLYDSALTSYVPTNATIDNLTNVDITSVANGETLVYNSTTSKWENGAGGGGGGTLSGLSDVTITSVDDGDLIRYNSVTGKYINDPYARGLSTLIPAYMGGGAQIEAVGGNTSLLFVNGPGTYAGVMDNSFSTGTIGQCLTADGNGGLNWEQLLLENAAGGTLYDAVDDAAAASGGVPVGGIYRDGSTLKVRVS